MQMIFIPVNVYVCDFFKLFLRYKMKVFVLCTHWAYNSLIKRRFLGMTNKIIGDNIRRILAENKKLAKLEFPVHK